MLEKFNPELRMLLELNEFIHDRREKDNDEYHRVHIDLVKQYALILNKRLGYRLSDHKLAYIAYAHDLLKEQGLDESRERKFHGHPIPQNDVLYVRNNLDVLEKWNGMDDYFNSSPGFHPLAAAIFLVKELGVRDPEIIWPVMFHSCPIISIYKTLPTKTQRYIDITMLSDKLSSGYLRMNWRECPLFYDLEKCVFGEDGNELHYTLGLYLARVIGDKADEEEGKKALDYYGERLIKIHPWVNLKKIASGGEKIWPKRKSPLLKTQY